MSPKDLHLKVTVDTSRVTEAIEAVLSGRATPIMRRTLVILRDNHRTAAPRFAFLSWPKNFGPARKQAQTSVIRMAEGRLAAAAKAGYAHVSFERGGVPVFEISARGRAAL